MSFAEQQLDAIRLKRLSHVAIGVHDLERQIEFYAKIWGLEVVEKTLHRVYLRAAESHHHALELTTERRGLHHVAFEVANDDEFDRSVKILNRQNIPVILGPGQGAEPGVGKLLRFRDPEGNIIELVSQVAQIQDSYEATTIRPLSLNHVVLFTGDLRRQQSFCERVLGMRVTDTVPHFMTFLRCNPNHHSFGFIALPRRGLQHAAFDLAGGAELSQAIFHLGDAGLRRVDGPGRHGPGNMLFAYFEDPEKNLLELCAEIQQVDESSHQPKAWDMENALNLWNTRERMGPPPGFGFVLPLLAMIARLYSYIFSRARLFRR
jgi:catechol 2,3-dioxygenase-like lactoylglutathione lyase family enzyme